MTTITPAAARRAGMVQIVDSMHKDSPELLQVIADMSSIPNTKWARVNAGWNQQSIWRVPVPPVKSFTGKKI